MPLPSLVLCCSLCSRADNNQNRGKADRQQGLRHGLGQPHGVLQQPLGFRRKGGIHLLVLHRSDAGLAVLSAEGEQLARGGDRLALAHHDGCADSSKLSNHVYRVCETSAIML